MEGETKRTMSEKEVAAQARVDMWNYAFGFTATAVVKCAIELGIADTIESRQAPITHTDLSSTLKCSPSALYRIMRFLIHRGIFKEEITTEGHKGYVQTPLSHLLVRKAENSMAPLVIFETTPMMMGPWLGLSSRVLANGTSSFEAANGDNVWGYVAANPDQSKILDDGMGSDAKVVVAAVADGCPEVFEGVSSLVDVGGGNGTTLRELVKSFPWIHGINYDLPHVVSAYPKYKGVEHVGGDMFVSVPEADAIFLKWVLHDWGDDESIQILKNCKKAISKETGKVIILEAILEEKRENKFKEIGLLLDIAMMAHTNLGKERTIKEWAYVLNQAGFSRYTVTDIEAVQSVIVAYP